MSYFCLVLVLTTTLTATTSAFQVDEPIETNSLEAGGLACDHTQYQDDFKGVCRNLTCVPPLGQRYGLSCVVQREVSNSTFEVFLKMDYIETRPITLVDTFFVDVIIHWEMFLEDLAIYNMSYLCLYLTEDVMLSGTIHSGDYLVIKITIAIPPSSNVDSKFIDDILGLLDTVVLVVTTQFTTPDNTDITLRSFVIDLISLEEVSQLFGYMLYLNIVSNETLHELEFSSGPLYNHDGYGQTIRLLATTVCPLITLYDEEFGFLISFDGSLRLPEINASIPQWYFLENLVGSQLDSIMVCADQYDIMIHQYLNRSNGDNDTEQDPSFNATTMPMPIATIRFTNNATASDNSKFDTNSLSIVCTSLSIFCTLMTVITQIVSKKLRSQMDISNLALFIHVMIAQLFYQVGRDRKDTFSDQACRAIGILAHFFWLETVMWMNVCSVHFVRLHRREQGHRQDTSSWTTSAMHVFYTTSVSALAVAINIKYAQREDGGIGYGDESSCFISEKIMIWLTLALPIGAIMLFNITIFIIPRGVRVSGIVSNEKINCKYFLICVGLSTLIGCLWLCGIAYLLTGKAFLEYSFIILNACPGCFILALFVGNKGCFSNFKFLKVLSEVGNKTHGVNTATVTVKQTLGRQSEN